MTKTIPLSVARQKLPSLVKDAKDKLTEYVITVNGAPNAVLISHEEYESWKETNEILSDKKMMKEIRQSEKEMKEGKLIDWEDLKKELGWNV